MSVGLSIGPGLRAFEERLARLCVPHRALLELTHRCNFRCVHCYESDHQRTDELDTEGWRAIIDDLKDAGVLYLTFSGGEFLLRPDWKELALYARSLGFQLRLFTNASLVTEEVARSWADEVCPLDIEVSVYGGSPASTRAVTGSVNAYPRAVRGLEAIAAAGLRCTVKVIALKQNVHEVAEMKALAERLGFGVKVTGRLTPRDDGSDAPLAHAVPDDAWAAFHEDHEQARFVPPRAPDSRPCNAGRTGLAVGPNGDVYPCVDMRRPVGNLTRTRLLDFWRDHPFLDEVRAVRQGDFVIPENVDITKLGPLCMARNLMHTGSLTRAAVRPARRSLAVVSEPSQTEAA